MNINFSLRSCPILSYIKTLFVGNRSGLRRSRVQDGSMEKRYFRWKSEKSYSILI